ncbi:hypothetical protein K3495_g10677 [Podosphaera aphanis]|nr:hypothetical protein K3495_g10677 [Podosphaera aphanis]
MDWVETRPQYVKLIDMEQEPTKSNVEEFKLSTIKKFPRVAIKAEERNAQEEIQNLKQGETEALGAYHERAQDMKEESWTGSR